MPILDFVRDFEEDSYTLFMLWGFLFELCWCVGTVLAFCIGAIGILLADWFGTISCLIYPVPGLRLDVGLSMDGPDGLWRCCVLFFRPKLPFFKADVDDVRE